MKTQGYKSFLRYYYLSSFFFDFVFAYAIYNVLFNIRGLSVLQISFLLAFWALAASLFEIPTGGLADSWSRKKMLVIAPVIKSFCFVIWVFAGSNFYIYALGFVFWGLSSALVSGTTQALLFDELVQFGKKDEYAKILGKRDFYFYLSIAFSAIIGGVLANYDLNWALLFSVIPLFLSSFFAMLIKESPRVKSTNEIKYLQYIKVAYEEVKGSRILLYLFLYSLGISIFWNLEEFDQLYYKLTGLPIFWFGVVGFIWAIFKATGSFYAHKFKKYSAISYLIPFVCFLLLLVVGLFPSIPMIGVLLVSYLIISPLYILVEAKIQNNIKSISRATVTSINKFVLNFFGIFVVLASGVISKIWNLQAIYISAALFLLVFSVWTVFRRKIFE